jgi:hypothetical protein
MAERVESKRHAVNGSGSGGAKLTADDWAKADALARLAALVERIISPPADNVLSWPQR